MDQTLLHGGDLLFRILVRARARRHEAQPLVEINATEIRERVYEGLSIDFLVPEKVKEYIYNSNLYKV